MAYKFFTIQVPSGIEPRDWAKQMWDTYGFDYATDRFGTNTVCAWALDDDDELQEALEDDDVSFTTFEVEDLDSFFGL